MKKILALLIIFSVFLFTGCGNNTVSTVTTTDKNSTFSSTTAVKPSSENVISEEHSAKTTIKHGEIETEATETQPEHLSNNNTLHPDPPLLVDFTLESFAEFEQAYNTMSEEEFADFVYYHEEDYYSNGISTKEKASDVIEIVKNTTVALLDGKKENFYEITLYVENNYLFQPVILSESRNIGCHYYSSETNSNVIRSFEKSENPPFVKEIVSNGVTAKVFYSSNEYYIEYSTQETNVFGRFFNTENIKDVEADFARLSFVKIGDLL